VRERERERERERREEFSDISGLPFAGVVSGIKFFREEEEEERKERGRGNLYQQVNARNVDKRGGSNGSLARDRGE